MVGILKNQGRWSCVVSVLCVVMVLVVGTAQAVHSHADNGTSARHTCSLCSVPNAKLNGTQTTAVPVMVAVPMASPETVVSRIFRPSTPNFVRPPPAA